MCAKWHVFFFGMWYCFELLMFKFANALFDGLMGVIAFEIAKDNWRCSSWKVEFRVARMTKGVAIFSCIWQWSLTFFCFPLWKFVIERTGSTCIEFFLFLCGIILLFRLCYLFTVSSRWWKNLIMQSSLHQVLILFFCCCVVRFWMPCFIRSNDNWKMCAFVYAWSDICINDFQWHEFLYKCGVCDSWVFR